MAVKTRRNRIAKVNSEHTFRNLVLKYFPLWVLLALILVPHIPEILNASLRFSFRIIGAAPETIAHVGGTAIGAGIDVVTWTANAAVDVGGAVMNAAGDAIGDAFSSDSSKSSPHVLAGLFTQQVLHWEDEIVAWADEYQLDPNLLATVMQIESCGHPTVSSHAGAQGLFQVMPFHFDVGENMLDPNTNAMRGAAFLNLCLDLSNENPGLAMACYNGGPSVLRTPFDNWHPEPQRYYYWGTGIYADAQQDQSNSGRLDEWLNAGGVSLCDRASRELGLS